MKIFRLIIVILVSLLIYFAFYPAAQRIEDTASCMAFKYADITVDPDSMILPVGPVKGSLRDSCDQVKGGDPLYFTPIGDSHEFRESVDRYASNIYPTEYGPFSADFGVRLKPYLTKSETVVDSLKMRLIARIVKAKIAEFSHQEDYAEFCQKNLRKPVAISAGFEKPGRFSTIAAQFQMSFGDWKGRFFNNVMLINDLDGMAVSDMINEGTLSDAFVHESYHSIMIETYGVYWKKLMLKRRSKHHYDVTDPVTAFVEGWAEAFETIYSATNPGLKNGNMKSSYSTMISQRLLAYEDENALWSSYDPLKTSEAGFASDSVMKNGNQILSSEEIIAALFHTILSSEKIEYPFIKCICVMFEHHPTNFIEFLYAWAREFPVDRDYLFALFCEKTRYATVSAAAAEAYGEYRHAEYVFTNRARYDFSRTATDEIIFEAKKRSWLALRDSLKELVSRSGTIDQAIMPDLDMTVTGTDPETGAAETDAIGLASVTASRLHDLNLKNLSDEDIVKFIKYRDQHGLKNYSDALGALSDILGERFEPVKKNNSMSNRSSETFNYKEFVTRYEPWDRKTYGKLSAYLAGTKSSEFLGGLLRELRK